MVTLLNYLKVKKENWQGQPCIVAEGVDERNGSYPYEIEVGVREGKYNHEGAWVAYRRYRGGLNRLSDDCYQYFDSKDEAVQYARKWL